MNITDLPNFLPSDADLDAEEAALGAEDAAAGPMAPRSVSRPNRRDGVARILAAYDLDGLLGAPPRSAISPRPTATSLLAWAADPVATTLPLRLPTADDPGDVVRSGGFAVVAVARAVGPDLGADGWATSAGSLVHYGAPASDDDLAEAVCAILRTVAAAPTGVATITQPDWTLGGRGFRPVPRFAERVARLRAHAERTASEPDRDGTGARAARAWYAYAEADALLDRPHHDPSLERYGRTVFETLADLTTQRTRRALASAVRSHLPQVEPRTVVDLADARGWLASLTRGAVVTRPDLWPAYVTAGAPGGLDKPALLRLAVEALGPARKRHGVFVHVIP